MHHLYKPGHEYDPSTILESLGDALNLERDRYLPVAPPDWALAQVRAHEAAVLALDHMLGREATPAEVAALIENDNDESPAQMRPVWRDMDYEMRQGFQGAENFNDGTPPQVATLWVGNDGFLAIADKNGVWITPSDTFGYTTLHAPLGAMFKLRVWMTMVQVLDAGFRTV